MAILVSIISEYNNIIMRKRSSSTKNTFNPSYSGILMAALAILFVLIIGMFMYLVDRPIIILGDSEIGIRQITGIEYPCRTTRRTPDPDVLEDPYIPPVKKMPAEIIAPINTQPIRDEYSQMGILTRKNEMYRNGGNELILPLMGRMLYSRRDKFQYYTISNTGNLNTKLPIRHKGQNAMSEYGCDEIFSRDIVYVNGYDDYFIATIYENNAFIYTPNIS